MGSIVNAKGITHIFAVIITFVSGFLVSPAGQSLIAQYPKLAPIAGLIAMLLALYHSPVKSA